MNSKLIPRLRDDTNAKHIIWQVCFAVSLRDYRASALRPQRPCKIRQKRLRNYKRANSRSSNYEQNGELIGRLILHRRGAGPQKSVVMKINRGWASPVCVCVCIFLRDVLNAEDGTGGGVVVGGGGRADRERAIERAEGKDRSEENDGGREGARGADRRRERYVVISSPSLREIQFISIPIPCFPKCLIYKTTRTIPERYLLSFPP